jgi:hypothetical protein
MDPPILCMDETDVAKLVIVERIGMELYLKESGREKT